MKLTGFDHIVLVVNDLGKTCEFYREILGMEVREEKPGKFSLHFGTAKISLQQVGKAPAIAKNTLPGTANFCLLSETDVDVLASRLQEHGVAILSGPGERQGALGTINSVYFHDPDGNLVEVANQI